MYRRSARKTTERTRAPINLTLLESLSTLSLSAVGNLL